MFLEVPDSHSFHGQRRNDADDNAEDPSAANVQDSDRSGMDGELKLGGAEVNTSRSGGTESLPPGEEGPSSGPFHDQHSRADYLVVFCSQDPMLIVTNVSARFMNRVFL